MDQRSLSPPPPPYTAEYAKPPPYFTHSPPPPQRWVQPQPTPTHGPHTSQQDSAGATRPITITTVTTTPAYVVTNQPSQHRNVQVLQLGNCPACRIGFLRKEFQICGILMAIIFFPIGILCCLCMMEKRCSYCGARF